MFTKSNVLTCSHLIEVVNDAISQDDYNRIWNMVDPRNRFYSKDSSEHGRKSMLISPELILNELVRLMRENEDLRSRIFKIKLALE